jgi:hypothetical protein
MNEAILWIALGPYAALAAIVFAIICIVAAITALGWLCQQAGSVIDSALRPNLSHRDH